MKKHEIIFSTIKVPLDFLIIVGSFFIAREIRQVTDLIPQVSFPTQTINTSSLFYFALFGGLLYVFLFASHGLYSGKISNSKIKELGDIIRYSLYWFVFFLVSIYLAKGIVYEIDLPRLMVLYALVIGTFFVIVERILLNNLNNLLVRKKIIEKNKILLVNNKKFNSIKYLIDDIKNSNIYNIMGYINKKEIDNPPSLVGRGLGGGIEYIGKTKDIKNLIENNEIDEILFIDSDFNKKELFSLWDLARIYGVRYRYITNSFDITSQNSTLSLINTIPVIELKSNPMGIWGRVVKRIFDLITSLIGIIIIFPIMIIVAILIKMEDPSGPVIYKNRRVGQGGILFNAYKFRYLKWEYCTKESYGLNETNDNAIKIENELIEKKSTRKGPLYKIKDDPRKTKIGNFIEKYSIDEIPQLFNVIIGNMSLVGPRPHQPREVKKYELHQKRVLTIKPGITGMAQVNGREKNTFEDETKLDIFYIENWNIILDLKIILKTFPIIFKR